MTQAPLFTLVLPLVVGAILFILLIDAAMGRRDRKAKRSRLILILLVGAAEVALIAWRVLHTSHPEPFRTHPLPPLISDPPGTTALTTEASLNVVDIPPRDAIALQALLAPDVPPTSVPALLEYMVGDRGQFQLGDQLVEAELIHINGCVHAWLVAGVDAEQEALAAATDRFATEVLPVVYEHFCPQCSQGEATIHILNYQDPDDGMLGFFLPDTGTFYVNLTHRNPEEASYVATLAHELQHKIHWDSDPNEERWLDEGLSDLAKLVAGFDPGSSDEVFRETFDTQLNDWPHVGESATPTAHYGASYRFVLYLWEQFGDEFIQDLVQHPANGLPSIDAVLTAHGTGLTADDIFADWVLANAVDVGEYAYDHEEWKASLPTWAKATFYRYPMDVQTAVHPYAADYFRLENESSLLVRFEGTTQARLLPTDPRSGESCWWSNAAHHSDTRLTRSFDLSGLSTATLHFWMWHDMERGDSAVYLSVSRDGGRTWTVLQGGSTAQQGDYGWGYTGQSNGWVEEQVDLSPYAEGEVWVRFDSVTRHSTHDKGFLLDDLSIPELGLEDTCEEIGDWQAEGFILAGPTVPVRWTVQFIDVYREGYSLRVYRMSLDEQQTGQLELELRPLGGLLGSGGRGIVVISAAAWGTTEPLAYHCEIISR